jgi:hypothetical protein
MKNRLKNTVRLNCGAAWLGAFLLLNAAVFAAPLKIVLPAETASFRATPGAELAMAQCLQCHSAEYITTQPPLGRDAWRASIDKMRKKYGASIPTETEATLLDYLVGTYGKPSEASVQK